MAGVVKYMNLVNEILDAIDSVIVINKMKIC